MTIVYIGLGSNLAGSLGAPKQQIARAIEALAAIPSSHLLTASSFYQSKPIGPQDQDDYINAVAQLETTLSAWSLLDQLQIIEQEHQRTRERHWGARTLDLDLLLYGVDQIQNKRLTVPHIEMLNRAFVLLPLVEINPNCMIPGKGLMIDYLSQLDQTGLQRVS